MRGKEQRLPQEADLTGPLVRTLRGHSTAQSELACGNLQNTDVAHIHLHAHALADRQTYTQTSACTDVEHRHTQALVRTD